MGNFDWLDSYIQDNGNITETTLQKSFDESCNASGLTVSDFNEEYIGKIPEFTAIDKEFEGLLQAYAGNRMLNPNTRPETRNIEAIIKKFFGLKACKIWWKPIYEENAGTYVDAILLHDEISSGILQKQKGKGFYDVDHQMTFAIAIHNGILSPNRRLTARELTAIIIHELGHNCDDSPYNKMDRWTAKLIELLGESAHEHNEIIKSYGHDTDKAEDTPLYEGEWWKLYDKMYNNEVSNMVAANRSDEFLKKRIKAMFNHWRKMRKYREDAQLYYAQERLGEQYADSFAAAYGYGPELISGLQKMRDHSMYKVGKKSRMNDFLYEVADIQLEMILLIADPHATNQVRCKDLIIKLRNDLKKTDCGSEIKKSLEAELDKVEKTYNEILTNGSMISRMWHKFVDKNYNGGAKDVVTRYLGRHQM